MAQSNIVESIGSIFRRLRFAKNTSVSVAAAGNTTLLQVDVTNMERLFVQMTPTTNGFDAFLIQAKPHPDGSLVTLYSAAVDFTAPAGLLVGASGDLTALAAASTGWFVMDVRGLQEVKVLASGSGGTATVDVYAGGQ